MTLLSGEGDVDSFPGEDFIAGIVPRHEAAGLLAGLGDRHLGTTGALREALAAGLDTDGEGAIVLGPGHVGTLGKLGLTPLGIERIEFTTGE